MERTLLSYSEAAEQVQLFLQGLAQPGLPPQPAYREAQRGSPEPLSQFLPLSAAAGQVLAGEIRADRDQPPFARSTRDGFAGRADEFNTHQLLFIAGSIRAGDIPSAALGTGEICEIMTGAPVPPGADCVVMVEHTEQVESNSSFARMPPPRRMQTGDNIVPQAAEARAGQVLIPKGVRLGPAHIAMAAQCGYSRVEVVPRPRVAILSTGDELVSVESMPGPSQIRNSNSPMLAALVSAAGAEPVILPVARDNEAAVDAAIAEVIALAPDLLLITGGISAGKFDLVEEALTRAGARFFFGGVAMQPGKPVVFGQIAGQGPEGPGSTPLPFFALPGNPISSAVTFLLFAAPLLAALAQDTAPRPRFALAELTEPEWGWSGRPGLTRFLPAWCDFGATPGVAPQVRLIPWQGSGDIAAFAQANCFVVIPDSVENIPAGSIVQILIGL